MRSIWKGAISFGLVTIPVGLYPATESKRPQFRQLRDSDHSRIRYKRTAESDGEEVPYENIVKGYEFEKGRYVVFSEEELDDVMKGISGGMVNVNSFVDESEIDPIYYERSYYLAPDEGGQKAFRLLHDTLEESSKIAVGKVVIREKEHLVSVRPYDGAMVMATLFYADEVRSAEDIPELPVQAKVHANEKKMALQLVEGMASGFDPAQYQDEYREALQKVITAKVEGEPVAAPERKEEKVVDLMEALRRSLQATRKEEPIRRGRRARPRAAALRERHR